MTDQEFEQKVCDLRDEFKRDMLAVIGGQNVFLSKNDQEFLDAFSIGSYASLSLLATLSSVLMMRYALVQGMTADASIDATEKLFHNFLHELLDKGQEAFLQNLQQYKNLKISN